MNLGIDSHRGKKKKVKMGWKKKGSVVLSAICIAWYVWTIGY